jgi:hypothetical protein
VYKGAGKVPPAPFRVPAWAEAAVDVLGAVADVPVTGGLVEAVPHPTRNELKMTTLARKMKNHTGLFFVIMP